MFASHRHPHRHSGGRGAWGFDNDRGGGRGRRMFDSGELRLVLLKLVADQPRHGYDLIRAIEERTGGAYAPSPGVIYPTITMLQDMELIEEQRSEGSRRLFAVTPAGTSHLDERTDEVTALFARLEALAARESRTGAGPIRRAMANLHMAVRGSVAGGERDDIIHQVAEILDEAVRKIERL